MDKNLMDVNGLKKSIESIFQSEQEFEIVINLTIEKIGSFFNADKVFIDNLDFKCACFVKKYEWNKIKKDYSRETQKYIPNIQELVKSEDYLLINNINELNQDFYFLKKYLSSIQVNSILIYPIKFRNQILGNIGLNYKRKNSVHSTQIEILRFVTELILHYYEKEYLSSWSRRFSNIHKQFLNNFIYPTALINKDYKIIDINPKFNEFFNVELEDIINLDFIDVFSKYDREKIEAAFENVQNDIRNDVEIFKIINNEKKIIRITPFPIISDSFVLIGIIIKDITRYKVEESKLKKMAFYDSTTGLHNRNYFDYVCEKIKSNDYNTIGVIVLDIDNLKVVNDEFGHEEGDHLIINISRILYHIFSNEFLVARIGGDEFVVFMLNRNEEEIQKMINEFNHKIDYYNRYNDIKLNLSIGYAYEDNRETDIFALINKADEHMYINKKGKQRLTQIK